MGSVIENAKTKEKCQIFTPDDIVETMLDHVGYIDSLYGKTILENSCGNGQFLKGIVKRYKLISPILNRKMVEVQFATDGGEAYKKIFATDFDSIIYNLVINSIESFEETKISERQITIRVESDDDSLTVHYSDNGHGLTEAFKKNPYSIFEYGTTSKFDAEGNAVGTGLGMYIVASSINEYKGRYTITKVEDGFGLDITIPLSEEGR